MSTIAGTVASFDAQRGDGWIATVQGEQYYFHCVAIGDDTRSISVGARVTATRRVGLLGRDQAVNVYSVAT